jgi:hypothetical protein
MVGRLLKMTLSGWRPLAIGAGIAAGIAAVLVVRRERAALQATLDDYEAWWQHRDRVRSNGRATPPASSRERDIPQLFV